MTHLDDKTALITGGGRGIGRAIALQLAHHGAHVAVAARSETELVETTSRSRSTEETVTRVPAGGTSGEAACVRPGR